MKTYSLQVLIILTFRIFLSYCCQTCEAILNEVQCVRQSKCIWNQQSCITITDCSQLNQTMCNISGQLGLTCNLIEKTCTTFNCSELLNPKTQTDCYAFSCDYNASNNSCQDYTNSYIYNYTTCSTAQDRCNLYSDYATGFLCYFNGSNCTNTTIAINCSQYDYRAQNGLNPCSAIPYCTFDGTSCIQKSCAALNDSNSSCSDYFDNSGNYHHCEKIKNSCTEVPLKSLNQTSCLQQAYTTWTGSSCAVCADKTLGLYINYPQIISQNSQLINIIVLASMMSLFFFL